MYKPISALFSSSELQQRFLERIQQLIGFRKKAIKLLASLYVRRNGAIHIDFFIDRVNNWMITRRPDEPFFQLSDITNYLQNSVFSHRAFRAYLACCRLSAHLFPRRYQLPTAYIPINEEQSRWLDGLFEEHGLPVLAMVLMEDFDHLDEFLDWLVHDRRGMLSAELQDILERLNSIPLPVQGRLTALLREGLQHSVASMQVRSAAGLLVDYWFAGNIPVERYACEPVHHCQHSNQDYHSQSAHSISHHWYANFYRLYRYGWSVDVPPERPVAAAETIIRRPVPEQAFRASMEIEEIEELMESGQQSELPVELSQNIRDYAPTMTFSNEHGSLQTVLAQMLGLEQYELWSTFRRTLHDLSYLRGQNEDSAPFTEHRVYGLMTMILSWLGERHLPPGQLLNNLAVLSSLLDRPLLLLQGRNRQILEEGVWFASGNSNTDTPAHPVQYQRLSALQTSERLVQASAGQICPYILLQTVDASGEAVWRAGHLAGCGNLAVTDQELDQRVSILFARAVNEIDQENAYQYRQTLRNSRYKEELDQYMSAMGLSYVGMSQDGHCLHHALATWLQRHGFPLLTDQALLAELTQKLWVILSSINTLRQQGHSNVFAELTDAQQTLVDTIGESTLWDMLDALSLPQNQWAGSISNWGDENLILLTAVVFDVSIPFIYEWVFSLPGEEDHPAMQILSGQPNGVYVPLNNDSQGDFIVFAGFNDHGIGHWDILVPHHHPDTEEDDFGMVMTAGGVNDNVVTMSEIYQLPEPVQQQPDDESMNLITVSMAAVLVAMKPSGTFANNK